MAYTDPLVVSLWSSESHPAVTALCSTGPVALHFVYMVLRKSRLSKEGPRVLSLSSQWATSRDLAAA